MTGDGWPVTVEVNKSGKQVVRASIGLTLTCTSGALLSLPDFYKKLKISKKGKFGASFGPGTVNNPDGTKTTIEGSMSGKVNKPRTKASGRWQLRGHAQLEVSESIGPRGDQPGEPRPGAAAAAGKPGLGIPQNPRRTVPARAPR